jgi:hypothetical protein
LGQFGHNIGFVHEKAVPFVKNNQWFQSFQTAKNTLAGYEAVHLISKGQVRYLLKGKVLAQKQFIENLFGIAA